MKRENGIYEFLANYMYFDYKTVKSQFLYTNLNIEKIIIIQHYMYIGEGDQEL